MQDEFVVCYGVVSHAVWMRNFVSALGIVDSIAKPLTIFCDNNSTISFTKNNKVISTSKHINIKSLVVKEMVENGEILVKYIRTEYMLADPLTKGLRPIVFVKHVENMGLVSSFDVLG